MAALAVVVAYALGAIPAGVLLARRAGVDVRRAGSGNVGATNVARTAGARLGLATLLADVTKGALAVAVAHLVAAGPGPAAAAGLAAVVGHVFPPGGGGGKGVATALGVLAVLCPPAALAALGTFATVFGATRVVSLASSAGALAAPLAAWLLGAPPTVGVAALAMAALLLARHRDNFRRLRAGTEPRFRLPEKQAPPKK